MEKPSRGGEKRIAVWASHPEERGSDDVVAPPVGDHRVVPHRWGGCDRCTPSGAAAGAGHEAAARVRKRDVSFGPRTREGATAWDTFMTLAETATKLGVSFYHYMHDRVSGAYQMPSLADLIATRAQRLNLGASWNTS